MSDEQIFNGLDEEENTSTEAEKVEGAPAAKKTSGTRKTTAKKAKTEDDHIIRLHDSSEFPPGGLTVGVNGKFFRLQPDVDMEVPESVLEVLDHAVRTEPRRNEHGQVVGTRNVPRFPYTMVRRK